jgi:hypothetical protein
MMLNGHMIGLALYAKKNSAKAGADGRSLIVDLARQIRESSPVRPSAPLPDPVVPASTGTGGSLGALLGGLFPDSG